MWEDGERIPVGKQNEGRENFTGGENRTRQRKELKIGKKVAGARVLLKGNQRE